MRRSPASPAGPRHPLAIEVESRDPAPEREHRGERVIGDLVRAVAGHAERRYAARREPRYVEMVEADARRHDGPQGGQAGGVRGREGPGARGHDRDALGVRDRQRPLLEPELRQERLRDPRARATGRRPGSEARSRGERSRHDPAHAGAAKTHRDPLARPRRLRARQQRRLPHLLEECRDEFLRRHLHDPPEQGEYMLARVAIDYRSQITMDDDFVEAEVGITRVGRTSVTLGERIYAGPERRLAAEAEAVVVRYDWETGASRRSTRHSRRASPRARRKRPRRPRPPRRAATAPPRVRRRRARGTSRPRRSGRRR